MERRHTCRLVNTGSRADQDFGKLCFVREDASDMIFLLGWVITVTINHNNHAGTKWKKGCKAHLGRELRVFGAQSVICCRAMPLVSGVGWGPTVLLRKSSWLFLRTALLHT